MQLEWLDAAEIVKITHVAEIVNIRHVARILEAEICGAVNVCAIPLYNPSMDPRLGSMNLRNPKSGSKDEKTKKKFRFSMIKNKTRVLVFCLLIHQVLFKWFLTSWIDLLTSKYIISCIMFTQFVFAWRQWIY